MRAHDAIFNIHNQEFQVSAVCKLACKTLAILLLRGQVETTQSSRVDGHVALLQ